MDAWGGTRNEAGDPWQEDTLCAQTFIVAAVRTGGEGHAGISLLVIERDTPGYSVSQKLDKMGWCASDTAILSFEDCRVPVDNLVGPQNAGFLAIMTNFASERLYLAAQCVAIAELAYRESVAYAKVREAFGKTLMGHQWCATSLQTWPVRSPRRAPSRASSPSAWSAARACPASRPWPKTPPRMVQRRVRPGRAASRCSEGY